MNQPIPFTEKGSGIVPRGRPFIKMHGLRNDFIVVDGRTQPYRPSIEEIVQICDRREGVGGDELLIIEPPIAGSARAAAFVRIFNPDGREVEACGNASRCVGWLLLQESKGDEVLDTTPLADGSDAVGQALNRWPSKWANCKQTGRTFLWPGKWIRFIWESAPALSRTRSV